MLQHCKGSNFNFLSVLMLAIYLSQTLFYYFCFTFTITFIITRFITYIMFIDNHFWLSKKIDRFL